MESRRIVYRPENLNQTGREKMGEKEKKGNEEKKERNEEEKRKRVMLLPRTNGSLLLVQRTVTRTIVLQETIGKEVHGTSKETSLFSLSEFMELLKKFHVPAPSTMKCKVCITVTK
ncbi:hypothetical protein STEG23_031685 [Scotinomys teguina]